MNEKENDVFFSFNQKKLSISVFKKLDGSLIFFKEENIDIHSITENSDFTFLEKTLEKNIKQLEQKVNSFVKNIFLMIDSDDTLPIYVSLTKKLDDKKIKEKDIKYLIQDAKQQISRAYPEKYILHIIVKKYIVNGKYYTFAPLDIDCNKISIEIKFICFPKNLIKKIEVLFHNFQITIDKIICSNYAKSFIEDIGTKNICQIGHQLKNGFNKQEVVIIPKKIEKKGFFEKLFHLFR